MPQILSLLLKGANLRIFVFAKGAFIRTLIDRMPKFTKIRIYEPGKIAIFEKYCKKAGNFPQECSFFAFVKAIF